MSTVISASPRIEALPDARLPSAAAASLAAVKAKLGRVPNLHRTLAHAPAALDGYLALSGALAKGALRPALREKLALTVASRNGCAYCTSAHTAIGTALKIDAGELAANRSGTSSDPRDAAVLDFASELVAHKGRVPDAALAAVREAGFTDAEIVEVVAHVALNGFTNTLNELARTEIDFPPVGPGR